MLKRNNIKNKILHYPIVTAIIGIVAALPFLFTHSGSVFQYERQAIGTGEFWRILTGHIIHWNFEHFFWCTVVFLALGAISEKISRKGYVVSLAASSVVIPLSIWVLMPGMAAYRGLSGLGSSVFLFGTVWLIQECYHKKEWKLFWASGFAAMAFMGKVLFEYANESALFVKGEDIFSPVPLVHLMGGIIGLLTALWLGPASHCRARRP